MVITLGREFGSGGRELGRRLADRMQIAYYDKEILTEISKRTQLTEEYVHNVVEHHPYPLLPITIGRSLYPDMTFQIQQSVYIEQSNIIKEMAAASDCIIVGRCADYILRDRTDALHVFIHADMAHRAERIVRLYGETKQSPEKRLNDKDSKRKIYYKHYTNRNWGEAQNYHLCLNSGLIGVEKCADIIVDVANMDE